MHGSAIGGTIVSAGALDRLVHRQTLLTHVWPFLHLPQVNALPQPSAVVPQFSRALCSMIGAARCRITLPPVGGTG